MNADEDKGKKSARICVNCGYFFIIQEDTIVFCFSENDLAKSHKVRIFSNKPESWLFGTATRSCGWAISEKAIDHTISADLGFPYLHLGYGPIPEYPENIG